MSQPPAWMELESALQAQLRDATSGPARGQMLRELDAYASAVVRAARERNRKETRAVDLAPAMSWLQQPVFICGHHRSGTTLLQDLLDGHPELLVLPSEGTYFTSFRRVARANPRREDLDAFAREWISRLVDPNYSPHFKLGLSGENTQPYLEFASRLFAWQVNLPVLCPDVAQFGALLSLVAAYRDVAQPGSTPRHWVEKTPLNERHVPDLLAFEHARFIQVVRHPGDSFASLMHALQRGGVANPPRAAHAADIGASLRLAIGNLARYPDRYLVVRYEDLTDPAAREMERVRTFLGIRKHESLGRPTSAGIPVRSNSSFDRGAAGVVHRSAGGAPLDARDAEWLSAFAGEVAPRFGYELPPLSRVRRGWLRARHAPTQALRGLRNALR